MFNLLLILAGILEYILLAIDPKVIIPDLTPRFNANAWIGQFPEYLSRGYSYRGRVPKCFHWLVPSSEIRSNPRVFLSYDPSFLSRSSRRDHWIDSRCTISPRRRCPRCKHLCIQFPCHIWLTSFSFPLSAPETKLLRIWFSSLQPISRWIIVVWRVNQNLRNVTPNLPEVRCDRLKRKIW